MEAICSSETSVHFQRTTRRYIPEDGTLHNHRCENLKSYIMFACFSDTSHRLDAQVCVDQGIRWRGITRKMTEKEVEMKEGKCEKKEEYREEQNWIED
jgi:hypothetical protein